jgi:hypothetical protein
MHAVLVEVDIDPTRVAESATLLREFTIPAVKTQPGFVRGTWVRSSDSTRGRGWAIFDTEEHAASAAVGAKQGPPPGGPITVLCVEVFEVVGEA